MLKRTESIELRHFEDSPHRGGSSLPYNLIVSAFIFLLFWEWLRPLTAMAELTDIHRLNPFIWAVGAYLLIDALRVTGWIGWPLKAVFTAGWIGYWFRPDALASHTWWRQAASIAENDLQRLLNAELFALSPESRTFVFLLGWAALVYAVQRIVTERGQGVWFVGATVGFLLLLQLWPGIDTNEGLIRAAAWGLMMLAVLNGPKWELLSGFGFAGGKRSLAASAAAGAVLGAVVLGGGYALSASLPKTVEPVSLEPVVQWAGKAAIDGLSFTAEAKTGYGSYDGNLGAPVTADDSVAFVARSSQPSYWRGESKDIYTGRGWRKSALSDGGTMFQAGGAAGDPAADTAISQRIAVVDESFSRFVFAGGSVLRFTELTSRDGESVSEIHIRHDEETGSYYVGTNTVELSSYAFEASAGKGDWETLLSDRGTVPEQITRRNLQLPDGLPARVKQLAEQIVEEVPDNRLLRVSAVQRFLHESYTYTLDTELPPRGADFADTFLFERRAGYCNHFSTAMVVLLRSIGIESRWVKGFAPGTPDADNAGTYVVRNKDAHSWVEVYFPGAGWVPFEATPGFGGEAVNMVSADEQTAGTGAQFDEPSGNEMNSIAAAPAATASTQDEWFARASGWLTEASNIWNETAAAAKRLKRQYDAAVAEDGRLPAAMIGLAGIGIIAAAAPLIVKLSASRRGPRLPSMRRDPASAAAIARLDAFWTRMYRRYGQRSVSCTLREYVAGLPPHGRKALEELLQYDELVRFGGGTGRRATRQWLEEVWRKVSGS
ncbi:transglutaminase-like domain-containing protein [Paenibacillus alkalitolerans]|uniref:transglutaminase-like domain-containing protein n=1 Tax=Paenibacillus alkalitolerans TaxID=2799335 RepID=UPI0018F63708|nr:transglutaminase-like domain-containing protein [Paenibacillus alkalitolerans]